MTRALSRAALAIAVLVLSLPGTAQAEFQHGAALVSFSPDRREQADAQTVALDISADGRYVAFQTRARNMFPEGYADPPGQFRQGGIFRRDLQQGSLELVAFGDLLGTGDGTTFRSGARNPSISGNGRYVAFTSADPLAPTDTNTRLDVYVRDMDQPLESPTAFELVSARDGGDQPATYGGPPTAVTGSLAPPESALSEDGRKVVFGTAALSDLPAADLPTVAPGQLFVRDLDAKTTLLVTRNKNDGTPAGGVSTGSMPSSISGDGSVVAWPGRHAEVQTRLQPGEPTNDPYYMWRRVGDGPSAPTRRISGASDVDDPQCPETEPIDPFNITITGPCYGPLAGLESFNSGDLETPSLSRDGMRVAFVTTPPIRPAFGTGNQMDAYVTDMASGFTRKAATLELTRELIGGDVSDVRPVKISGDGRRLVFVTSRLNFPLPVPRLISAPPGAPNPELYMVYLDRLELERISTAHDGEDIDGAIGNSPANVSVSGDGRRVAFTAGAANLFPGDANQVADAFVASEPDGGGGPSGPGEPPFDDLTPREDTDQSAGPVLPVSVRRGKGGALRVSVKAPQRGTVALTARARVTAGRKARLRPIAKASKHIGKAGRVTLVLRPASRYRRYLHRAGRLRSRLEARFIPDVSGRTLVARRTVSFTS